MDKVSLSIIETLFFLGNGFLAAWVFYGFTSFTRPSQFEQVVQAFIFTTIIQSVMDVEKDIYNRLEDYVSNEQLSNFFNFLTPTVNAFLIGIMFAFFANTDYFHALFRKLKITRETSFPSEWFGVFSKKLTYIVLHLKDERRIYGWPIEWPSDPKVGHFSLTEVSWLDEERQTHLDSVSSVLIKAQDVKWVEFMITEEEKKDVRKKITESTPIETE